MVGDDLLGKGGLLAVGVWAGEHGWAFLGRGRQRNCPCLRNKTWAFVGGKEFGGREEGMVPHRPPPTNRRRRRALVLAGMRGFSADMT